MQRTNQCLKNTKPARVNREHSALRATTSAHHSVRVREGKVARYIL